MHILRNRTNGEYVISKYRYWIGYELIPFRSLKEKEIYFRPDDKMMSLLGLNYRPYFRGYIPLKVLDTTNPVIEKYNQELEKSRITNNSSVSIIKNKYKKEGESPMDRDKRYQKMFEEEEKKLKEYKGGKIDINSPKKLFGIENKYKIRDGESLSEYDKRFNKMLQDEENEYINSPKRHQILSN